MCGHHRHTFYSFSQQILRASFGLAIIELEPYHLRSSFHGFEGSELDRN